MKKIRRITSASLCGMLVMSNTLPSFAATQYQTSEENVIYEEYDEDVEAVTDVHCEIASSFTVRLPKDITLGGESKKANYEVVVGGDLAGVEKVIAEPEPTVTMKQNGKDDIIAEIHQSKVEWAYDELDVVGEGEISAPLTAGRWNGQFTFNVYLGQYRKVIVLDKDHEELKVRAEILNEASRKEVLSSIQETEFKDEVADSSLILNVEVAEFEGDTTAYFDVSDFAKPGEQVSIFHYNSNKSEWEFIGVSKVNDDGWVDGKFDNYSPVIIEKHSEHKYSKLVDEKALTCTEDGYKTYECSCGDRHTDVLSAIGHQYVEGGSIAQDYTCTTDEIRYHKCSVCGIDLDTTYRSKEAPGHTSVHGGSVKQPQTCTQPEIRYDKCAVCGIDLESSYQSQDALGHNYVLSTKDATCTTAGLKTYTCSNCNDTYTEDIPAKGHVSVEGGSIVQAQTCTLPEIRHHKCSVCGVDLDTTYQSKEVRGHDNNGGTRVTGYGQCTGSCGYYKCSGCGKDNTWFDTRTNHYTGSSSTKTQKTCTTDGYVAVYCGRCNKDYAGYKVAAGHGHYSWREYTWYSAANGQTGTQKEGVGGYYFRCAAPSCDDCGAVQSGYQGVTFTGNSSVFRRDPICGCAMSGYNINISSSWKSGGRFFLTVHRWCSSCGASYWTTAIC